MPTWRCDRRRCGYVKDCGILVMIRTFFVVLTVIALCFEVQAKKCEEEMDSVVAPYAGLVRTVHVQRGDVVSPLQRLVTIESLGEPYDVVALRYGRIEILWVRAGGRVNEDEAVAEILPMGD